MLIGTKIDLVEQRLVSYQEGQELAAELGMKFYETSAKESSNFEEILEVLTQEILTRRYF